MNEQARQNAFRAGIAALVMIYYGWFTGWLIPADASAFYEQLIVVFDWTLKLGGIAFGLTCLLCLAGLRAGLLLDVFVSGICGIVLVVCPAYWLFHDGIDLQNILYLIVGLFFIGSARHSWTAFAETFRTDPKPPLATTAQPVAREPEPVHPASIHPAALPGEDEPPPEEGYLAALSKEPDEPNDTPKTPG